MERARSGSRSVLVAGAGIPGLSLALALKHAHGAAIDVTVCDPALPRRGSRHRGRAFALGAGARRLYEGLGLWADLAPYAEPILDMAVSDSRLADPVRPVFLTFQREDAQEESFAHMIEAEPVVDALVAAAASGGIHLLPVGVRAAIPMGGRITVSLDDGTTHEASLLVAADGPRSRLREAAGIGWVGGTYPQAGIVATLSHERSHEGRAYEHFLPSGPFAILPLRPGGALGHRSSIVWTERAADTAALTRGHADDVLAAITQRFGSTLGCIALEDGPSAYPLGYGMARRFRAERLALLGDAAHVIHPIAGQGLNLGLAAVAALADAVGDAMRLGLDIGSADMLIRYERARRFETLAMASVTDGLNRLFSNDVLALRLARDFGLGVVDRLPGLKRFLIGRAAALRDAPPLRGDAS